MPSRSSKTDYASLAGVSKKGKDGKKSKTTAISEVKMSVIPEEDISEAFVPAEESLDCASCKVLANLVRTLLKKQDSLEKEVQSLKSGQNDTELLKKDVKELKDHIGESDEKQEASEMLERVKLLEKKVEDRTNRQLRQTMVLRGLKELPEEESWSDTRDLVASKISELLNIEFSEAKLLINRCHRGGNTQYYKSKNRIRPIYIAFMRWDTCEDLLQAARGQHEFSLDYKFGPRTTVRRNRALKLRRELKQKGELVKAFVKFPAILMGKKTVDSKYEKIRDFSNDEVVFEKDN